MKKIVLFALLILFISCKNDKRNINQTVPYEDTLMLLGEANKTGFLQDPFMYWFEPEYDGYKVNDSLIQHIKPLLKDVSVKAFMGTWCSDSQRETPRFYKILEAAHYNLDNLTVIAVNDEKTTPQEFEKGLNITNVPTFIFYKEGQELNRIVEYPLELLELDILNILQGKEYKHAYAE